MLIVVNPFAQAGGSIQGGVITPMQQLTDAFTVQCQVPLGFYNAPPITYFVSRAPGATPVGLGYTQVGDNSYNVFLGGTQIMSGVPANANLTLTIAQNGSFVSLA